MAEEIYYLIDFENVGLKGLEGAEKLSAHDHVHLFSTRNAPKITTAILANFNATNLMVHEVPAKSQSLDMHLVSYLGYLLGSCNPIPEIVILSNDNDYDDITQYWRNELGISVKRRGKFQADDEKPAPVKQPPAKAPASGRKSGKKDGPAAAEPGEKKSPAVKKDPAAKALAPEDRTAVNNAVMKALSSAKFDNDTVGFVASQVSKLFSEKNGKQQIYRSIISKYGQGQGLNIYNHIKKLL